MNPLARYRGTGADLPFQDPGRSHPGVAMEGYFWRVTDPGSGRVLIALIGVNQGPSGPWTTVGLASSDGFLRTAAVPGAWAARDRLGAGVEGRTAAPARSTGQGGAAPGVDPGQLNQYWHPWLLAGRATGSVRLGSAEWVLDGAHVYGEKNWGAEGFPDSWWWGQAHGFAEPGATVAFAGGQVHARPLGIPLRTEVTALVVRLPGGRVLRLGDPGLTPVTATVDEDRWHLAGVDRVTGWRVEVEATSPVASAHVLPVPLPSEHRNTPGALEHLTGTLSVAVTRRGRAGPVWAGRSSLAGLEHGGLARAEAELARRGGDPAPPGTRGG